MKESYEPITREIIGLAMRVHTSLGPGLLESVYQECLYFEINRKGMKVEKEKKLPVYYETLTLDSGYRLDLLVEDKIVVELKSVEEMRELYTAQLLTYMKLGNFPVGLLINFNVPRLKEGIKRLINGKYAL